jgi:two-component system copper resistance phosphate regulon response regulator CusR
MANANTNKPMIRILVVDDDPDTLDLVKLTLTTAGYEVVLATNGSEALHLIDSFLFDLMLLDVMMPELSGFDVMRKLHKAGSLPPPVIILSALGDDDAIKTGEELGVFKYLVKPISRGALLDSVQAALGIPRDEYLPN